MQIIPRSSGKVYRLHQFVFDFLILLWRVVTGSVLGCSPEFFNCPLFVPLQVCARVWLSVMFIGIMKMLN